MNRLLHLWNVLVRDPAENAVVWVRILIILFFLNTVAKWLFNIREVSAGTTTLALFGLLVIVLSALSLRLLAIFSVGGGVNAWLKSTKEQKRDLTEGILKGLGLEYRIVVAFAMCDVFSSIVLMVRDFSQNPGSFWVFYLAITLLVLIAQNKFIRSHPVRHLLTMFGIMVAAAAIWQSPGGAHIGQSFDPDTGEPLIMVDPLSRDPDIKERKGYDCRTTHLVSRPDKSGVMKTYEEVKPHKSAMYPNGTYDYANEGTCLSAESGLPLVPLTPEEAVQRSRPVKTAWAGIWPGIKHTFGAMYNNIASWFNNDPEVKFRRENGFTILKEPCPAQYAKWDSCRQVTISPGRFYPAESPSGHCIMNDAEEKARRKYEAGDKTVEAHNDTGQPVTIVSFGIPKGGTYQMPKSGLKVCDPKHGLIKVTQQDGA